MELNSYTVTVMILVLLSIPWCGFAFVHTWNLFIRPQMKIRHGLMLTCALGCILSPFTDGFRLFSGEMSMEEAFLFLKDIYIPPLICWGMAIALHYLLDQNEDIRSGWYSGNRDGEAAEKDNDSALTGGTALLPCPNPDCRSGSIRLISVSRDGERGFGCMCGHCLMTGPYGRDTGEAARLWNMQVRPQTLEAWIWYEEVQHFLLYFRSAIETDPKLRRSALDEIEQTYLKASENVMALMLWNRCTFKVRR